MRHIFIGDVHGCIDELKCLIKAVDPNEGDLLYFLGDLIDRGPDSVAVVRYALELSKKYDTKLIIGNHEEKFLRYLNHLNNNPKLLSQMNGIDEFKFFNDNFTIEEINFIRNSYFNFNVLELGVLLVHGGVSNNSLFELDSNHKYEYPLPKKMHKISLVTKTRYLDESGVFISSNMLTPSSYFWAEKYPKLSSFIIFGHTPFIQNSVRLFNNAMGVDTGCVYGGWLTAAVFTEKNNYKIISVKSNSIYFKNNRNL
jgi:serine/threonine protein phosphatase 1